MGRLIGFAYGVGAYAVFFASFLYLVGFLANVYVPKGIDDGVAGPTATALAINLGLVALFGLQHSVMARRGFKQWLAGWLSPSVERSTYVLASSLVMILMYWQWQPMPQLVWEITNAGGVAIAWTLYGTGFLIVLMSTFIISHFDLFGLKQVTLELVGRDYKHPPFRVTWFYRFVRHPIYLGFLLAFWSTPQMSQGHLVFTLAMTIYVFIGIHYEERDLVRYLGDDYRRYAARVPMLLPVARPHETINAYKDAVS